MVVKEIHAESCANLNSAELAKSAFGQLSAVQICAEIVQTGHF